MKKSPPNSKISRRHFLAVTGAAIAFPTIIPSSALGGGGVPPPSERIVMGAVGCGIRGPQNIQQFQGRALRSRCVMVAACDVDKNHLTQTVNTINRSNNNQDCKAYTDYRELLARTDIDAVTLAVPDHWHALVAVEAANHKKHIYGEKPLARTIAEQQAIVKAVQASGRTWQTGSWQRSYPNFHKAAEIVRNGLIGKITHVEVGLPGGPFPPRAVAAADPAASTNSPASGRGGRGARPAVSMEPSDPPAELDYDMWTGPSQKLPYIAGRIHDKWRFNYNTGGGQLMDWIGHHCDIAHWGLGFDNEGPTDVEAHGEFPPKDAVWNTATKYYITLKYPQDVTMTIAGGYPEIRSGCKWIGNGGWVWVDRGAFESSNPDWREIDQLPDDQAKIKLYNTGSSPAAHWVNFIDCVKSGKPTITPVETAHHSAIPGHLGLIAMLTGKSLKWDNRTETLVNGDSEAIKLLTRQYREPWKLA